MQTLLVPKIVECKCGNTFEATRAKTWCQKCCHPVFYHERDQRRNKLNNLYMMGVIGGAIMLVTYFFIEMIAVPLFG